MEEGVSSQVAERLIYFQPRCIVCGSTYKLHIHHRVFRSEGVSEMLLVLNQAKWVYQKSYGKILQLWTGIHDIQNLVRLCMEHHEGNVIGVHGGNQKLRNQLRYSFTCPTTGFNIPYYREKKLF